MKFIFFVHFLFYNLVFFTYFTHCTRLKTANKIQAIHGSDAYLFYYYFAFVGFSMRTKKIDNLSKKYKRRKWCEGWNYIKIFNPISFEERKRKKKKKREPVRASNFALCRCGHHITFSTFYIYGSKIYSFVYMYLYRRVHTIFVVFYSIGAEIEVS